MKINKIILENFRTFYGRHEIEFSTNLDKSLTIFIGENGSGKTTLLNAIYWAFTGYVTKQFSESNILLNKDAAYEKNYSCFVEIEFETEKQKFILIRKSIKTTETSDLALQIIHKNGHSDSINKLHIEQYIEKLIPKKLASWFIFDGEAIGNLHLNGDGNFKHELQQTFGFSGLKKLSDILSQIEKDFEREQRKNINDEKLNSIGINIDNLDREIEIFEEQLRKLRETVENAKREKESAEAELAKYDRAEPLQAKEKSAERVREEHRNKLKEKLSSRNDLLISSVPKVLIFSEIEKLINELNEREIQQSLPEPFGTRLIDDIQNMGICICGTQIEKGGAAYQKLEEIREKASSSVHTHRIHLLRLQIGAFISDVNSYDYSMKKILSEIGFYETEIANQDQLIRKIKELKNQIPDEKIRELLDKINKAELIRERAIGDIAVAVSRRDEKKNEVQNYRNDQEIILATLGRNSNLSKQQKKCEELSSYVGRQYERQEKEVLEALTEEVTGVLFKYLTKHFSAEVDKDTYAVKTLDIDRRLVPLSTGETNVLKFAVIAAIVGMAGSKTKIKKVNWITEPITAPLIFDAPFSVVDSEYRSGIANNLAELASQLILMFDSDKWDGDLSTLLLNKTGKFYTLVSRAKGSSKETTKSITINNKVYNLNEYNSSRDETLCVEVLI
jgi:DNA sulfur modification protein DndD